MEDGRTSGVRLAELIAALSLATDLGLGQPQEHVLKQTVIATRLARLAGFSPDDQSATYYVSLMALVGCVADSHELGRWFGDDNQIRSRSYQVDRAGMPMLRFLMGNVGQGESAATRLFLLGRFATSGIRDVAAGMSAHCQTTGAIAQRLGLVKQVQRALPQALERWDGKGGPAHLRAKQIEPSMRAVHVANEAEVSLRLGGLDVALEMLRNRRGSQFEPALVDLVVNHADELLADIDAVDAWETVIRGCAPLDAELSESELQQALETLADYADLKSPWFVGHSRAAAALAVEAARLVPLSAADVQLVERAALVSRLGGIGVSAATWDKPGPLTSIERERVRTVPYLTERILSRQPRLAEIGAVAAMFHERMDGSGYARGLNGAAIPPPARILAAAEVYQALREERPHRAALDGAGAREVLEREAAAGRLDGPAVRAVLAAAGHRVRRRPSNVAGLSSREIEVLQLLVRGRSNREIGESLFVSRRTVSSHVEHIYNKIGVASRGAAAMYAMQHGLIDAASPEV